MTSTPSDASCLAADDLPQREPPLHALLGLRRRERTCSTARQTVRQLLASWEVGREEEVHDVLVVVSELVGNAVRHGDGHLVLELAVHPGALLVAVSDGGPGLPQQREGQTAAESGRGLAIVGALATSWGSRALPDEGKRVWAVLPLHGSGPEATQA